MSIDHLWTTWPGASPVVASGLGVLVAVTGAIRTREMQSDTPIDHVVVTDGGVRA